MGKKASLTRWFDSSFLLPPYAFERHFKQALTMTVSANCKQVLTIVIAVMLFNLHIAPTNAFGILLTLFGGVSLLSVSHLDPRPRVPREDCSSSLDLLSHFFWNIGMVRLCRVQGEIDEASRKDCGEAMKSVESCLFCLCKVGRFR